MFRPRKHIKLDPLTSIPKLDDLQRALIQAQKNRASTVELPWQLKDANLSYSLAVRAEFGPSESVWTLYEGEGNRSHVVWSAPFTDMELLKEVVFLTVVESTGISHSSLPAQEEKITSKEINPEIEAQMAEIKETPLSPPPVAYAYFYPGYAIPYPYPYPQGLADPQTLANTLPLQPGMPSTVQNQFAPILPTPNPDLYNKQKNFLLGQFLIETSLITSETLNIILKLQAMIASGLINTEKAIAAIKKAHSERSSVNVAKLIEDCAATPGGEINSSARKTTPLLGEILVKAEVINNFLLLAILKLQEVVRSGALTAQEACLALKKELSNSKSSKEQNLARTSEQDRTAVDLLIKAGVISQEDKDIAYRVQKQHGGKIDNILVAAGKGSKKTFAAALQCEYLLSQKKIKIEQVMIALNYCERSRVGLAEAIADLGWHADLDL